MSTPLAVPTGEISGAVFVDTNDNGVENPGESGLEGVEMTLTGVDAFGNPVEVVVLRRPLAGATLG